ncbi:hypothetical protein GOZ78_08970 [Agrobacterium vitis]|uniref:MarR family transcriptional regulator n=1 Tax=Agrobacterium vitis TaxID=373 RepID=A0ABD6GB15_AGRVI|nr:hypothetical protein [Agrobacterium vitis]MUO78172.1 hypothetical protein [Agrobacterium vitis]MUO94049.1 hypothetical protein [Agrobacterium vitis]MUP03496.1 hypothetical protein [Agrobacterium vitis]MUZ85043.1 hypothetical protein [Agrobacterium vitis]MVA10163.1 hypothetical protein [Agrobacterium vitis]
MTARLENGTLPTTLLHCLADGSCKTIDELDATLSLDRGQISDGAFRLIMRGYVERIEKGCYQLTPAGVDAAARGEILKGGPIRPDTASVRKPVFGTFRQRVWTAIRMGGNFTIGDIVMVAATAEDKDADNNARWYVRRLKSAGYVVELPIRQRGTKLTSSGHKRFRLVKDTGAKAPVYRPKTKMLHDYNLREDVPCSK